MVVVVRVLVLVFEAHILPELMFGRRSLLLTGCCFTIFMQTFVKQPGLTTQ